MSMKFIIAAAALIAVSMPAAAVAGGQHQHHKNRICGHHYEFVKGDSTAARGSIYDMAAFGTCERRKKHKRGHKSD